MDFGHKGSGPEDVQQGAKGGGGENTGGRTEGGVSEKSNSRATHLGTVKRVLARKASLWRPNGREREGKSNKTKSNGGKGCQLVTEVTVYSTGVY